jgi:hypothetical protein
MRQFMRELPERFKPNARAGRVQWVFFAWDSLSPAKGALRLSGDPRLALILAGHAYWTEGDRPIRGSAARIHARGRVWGR